MSETAQQDTLTGDHAIDPAHSTLGFVARHAMILTVLGRFDISAIKRTA